MYCGIQRRSVLVTPTSASDRGLFLQQLSTERARYRLARLLSLDRILISRIISASGREKYGHALLVPRSKDHSQQEFLYEITNPTHRNAYIAMHAADAMSHYAFDFLKIQAALFNVEASNRACNALIRRIGYLPDATVNVKGILILRYKLTKERWLMRRQRLEAYEQAHPGPWGSAFKLWPLSAQALAQFTGVNSSKANVCRS